MRFLVLQLLGLDISVTTTKFVIVLHGNVLSRLFKIKFNFLMNLECFIYDQLNPQSTRITSGFSFLLVEGSTRMAHRAGGPLSSGTGKLLEKNATSRVVLNSSVQREHSSST